MELQKDAQTNVAMRKLGNPADFKFYAWRVVGPDAVQLTGCVTTQVYSKGPRKGRPKYEGTPQVVVVTDAEMAAERARMEREDGICGLCAGDGRLFSSWDHITGTKYKPCERCASTGKAPSAVPPHHGARESGKDWYSQFRAEMSAAKSRCCDAPIEDAGECAEGCCDRFRCMKCQRTWLVEMPQ